MVLQPTVRAVPVGEQGVMVVLPSEMSIATLKKLQKVVRAIQTHGIWPITLQTTAYASALFRLRPEQVSAQAVANELTVWLHGFLHQHRDWNESDGVASFQHVEIPVCYDADFGPDLNEVARHHNLTVSEVIRLHHESVYHVAMIGFRPGFPYLLGLPPALATPRRAVPRLKVEAGSVAIGGAQTGVYPGPSAGGWHVIGRTPMRLFRSDRPPFIRLSAFDTVHFTPISGSEFQGYRDEWFPVDIGWEEPAGRSVTVLSPGLQTSVQDMGRTGYENLGVAIGGAVDWFSAAVANVLVGNSPDEAVLECTLAGPTLRFHHAALIAVTGADMAASVDGRSIPSWTSVWVEAGSALSLGGAPSHCRTYLAVNGGIAVREVFGGASTMLSLGIGGYHGRPLQRNDEVPLGEPANDAYTKRGRAVPVQWRIGRHSPIKAHFLASQTDSAVSDTEMASVCSVVWRVGGQSDRMGIRVEANEPMGNGVSTGGASLLSEPVIPGTIQLPPSGCPIVLMADAPTIGGYPTVGVVCMADLPELAQAPPGARIQFIPVDESYARKAYRNKLRCLGWMARQMELGVSHRVGRGMKRSL